jgi:hypothetical protein
VPDAVISVRYHWMPARILRSAVACLVSGNIPLKPSVATI